MLTVNAIHSDSVAPYISYVLLITPPLTLQLIWYWLHGNPVGTHIVPKQFMVPYQRLQVAQKLF